MKDLRLKISAVAFLLFIQYSLFINPAYAHVLKTDGTIGAVLHVDPQDDPVANQSTNFFFEFKDTSNKFDPKNCDCRVSILQGDKEIYSGNLFQNTTNPTLSDAVFSFIFPEKDIYKVKVEGKPNTPNAFSSFTLSYDVRVAKDMNEGNQNQIQNQGWWQNYLPAVLGIIIITMFGIIAFVKNDRKIRK
jgi:hypothetical protein